MLGRVGPGLVGDAAGRVGDAGALLGELQGGPLGLGEDRRLPPGGDQVDPDRALSRALTVTSVWFVRLHSTDGIDPGRCNGPRAVMRVT